MKSVILSEQPVILEKPAVWTRLFLWMILLICASAVVWAYFARVEQAVPAAGQLELQDGARDIQAPNPGTVVRLHVKEGDRVKKNQPLLTFSPTASNADLESLKKSKEALEKENKFYQDVFRGQAQGAGNTELETLIKERVARFAENQTLEALIDELYLNRGSGPRLSSNQAGLYYNYRAEYQSRVGSAQLQVQELTKQLKQAQDAEASARDQLKVAQSQLSYSQNQLSYSQQQLNSTREQLDLARGQLAKSKEVLDSNKNILGRLSPLVEQGAVAELQKDHQVQEVLRGESEVLKQQDQIQSREGEMNSRQGEINSRRSDLQARQGDILKAQAEIDRQVGEQQRILVSIERAKEQMQNTKDAWARELYTRMEDNKKAIANIDSQLSRYQVENQKKLSDINAQLAKAQQTRDTQVLKSPVDGVIYDLKPETKAESSLDMKKDPICQYVINTVLKPEDPRPGRCEEAYYEAQQTEKILKVMADENGLQAVVYLQNKDMALVLNAMRSKREKLEKYNGKELGGEKIECEPGKACVCPQKEENLEKLGLKEKDCIPVDVQVESFPSLEYGTIPGEVKEISQDAIEPTQTRQYYSFKTKIKLKRQYFDLEKDNNLQVKLQSGMAVSSNINIGKRTVLDMFISRFTGKLDSLKNVK